MAVAFVMKRDFANKLLELSGRLAFQSKEGNASKFKEEHGAVRCMWAGQDLEDCILR